MEKELVLNLLTNKSFGIPTKNINRLREISNVDYQYICPDFRPVELQSDTFKKAFLKFHEVCVHHQYLTFKYNHNEGCYFFDTEDFHLTYLNSTELEALTCYMNRNTDEKEVTWTDSFVFNAQIGSYRFKKIYKDGYNYVMTNIVYMADGAKDIIKISRDNHKFTLNYEINIFFRDNLFYVFDEYNNNGIFKKIIENLNNQMKLLNFISSNPFVIFHAKKNMLIKLNIQVEIDENNNLSGYTYYLLLKKSENKIINVHINLTEEETFIQETDGFIRSAFFEKLTNKIIDKYNIIIDTSTKEKFNDTLLLLEMIEY